VAGGSVANDSGDDGAGAAAVTRGVLPVWDPYCGTGPDQSEWLSRWNFDPVMLAGISCVAVLLWLAARDHTERKAIVAATAISFVLFVTPFCAMSSALFTVRVSHHVLLTAIVAPLLTAAARRYQSGLPGSLTVWTAVQGLVFWNWHAPPLYAAAMSDYFIYWSMQISLLGSSVGFWFAVRRSPLPQAVAALLATTLQMGLLGAIITFAATPLYAPHWTTTMAWGLTPLQDQQLAGLVMWAPAAGLYLAAALYLANRWLAGETDAATA
jgi:putative membrane protein